MEDGDGVGIGREAFNNESPTSSRFLPRLELKIAAGMPTHVLFCTIATPLSLPKQYGFYGTTASRRSHCRILKLYLI
jgi:hypothetical protein